VRDFSALDLRQMRRGYTWRSAVLVTVVELAPGVCFKG
jgi:hypothetical protein